LEIKYPLHVLGTLKSRNCRSGDNSLDLELGASATRVHQIVNGGVKKETKSSSRNEEGISSKLCFIPSETIIFLVEKNIPGKKAMTLFIQGTKSYMSN